MAAVVDHPEVWKEPDLETRKQLWRGLLRLGDSGRVKFARWCAQQVSFGDFEVRILEPATGRMAEVWGDVMMLAFQHGLSLRTACDELERRLSKGGV